SAVAVSANGRWIVSGSNDQTVRLWDRETGAQHGEALQGHTTSVNVISVAHYDTQPAGISQLWFIDEVGWVYSGDCERLFWLPEQLRTGFWMPLNHAIFAREQTKLSYKNFIHGENWEQCLTPPSDKKV
ncbi:hypothetical protein GGX14DRAFT_54889, partial [Mycena pura]